MIRLFAISDTHGLPWPSSMPAADLILFAGDLLDGASLDEDVSSSPPDPAVLAWRRRVAGLPDAFATDRIIAVRGNHDLADPTGFFAQADDLSAGRLRSIGDGWWICGIGWHGERYFELPTEDDLRRRCDDLRRAVRRQVMLGEHLILVSHYPPAIAPQLVSTRSGTSYAAISELARDLQPAAVISGHVHEWAGRVERVRIRGVETLIVMPGSDGMLVTAHPTGEICVQRS